jgi:glycosyltransferase involved in cell wall biosynthesis
MKILLSAFAFSPLLGSECGVGWHWAVAMARHHEVTVLTHDWFRTDVQAWLAREPVANLKVEYFHVEPFWAPFKRSHLDAHSYSVHWKRRLAAFAKTLQARDNYDLIHHLTWGSIRYPSWLGTVGKRYIAGPLGGGERAPWRFYQGVPWRARLKEVVRDMVLYSFKLDPIAQGALAPAEKIFCRTADTASFVPRRWQHKVVLVNEIGSPPLAPRTVPMAHKPRTTFLFAGRLLAWKGLHLALGALAEATRRGADVELLIVGEGDLRDFLLAEVERLGLQDRVQLRDRIPQLELMALYHHAEAFLFPSLHDSGGTVVLEALSRGVPVICLDLGGPQHFVTPACGTVVATAGASQTAVVQRLADAVCAYAALGVPARQAMHDAAVAQAARLTWAHQVEQVYKAISS